MVIHDIGAHIVGMAHRYLLSFSSIPGTLVKDLTALGLAFAIEAAFVGQNRSSLRRIQQFGQTVRSDLLAFFLASANLMPLIGMLLSFGTLIAAVKFGRVTLGDSYRIPIDHPLAAVACWVLLSSFVAYWFHRLCHTVPFLWEMHKYHHSANEMTILTDYRRHPLELAVEAAFLALPLTVFFQVPAGYPIALALYFRIQSHLGHSNLAHNWGWFGKYLLVFAVGP